MKRHLAPWSVVFVVLLAGCSRPAAAPASTLSAGDPSSSTPAPRAAFKFPTQTLSVPEGFTIELVAGPPRVNRPISIAFDPQGRLYATDSSGLSERADKQIAAKPHRIVRLEDADGDGRFERSVVFAENMMFPQGALFHEGSLYVAAPPQLWKLTDTNDDGLADERTAWYDGKTLTGCANDLHGPYLGPDGWFYWTKGAFAEQRHTLGNGKPFVTRAAHIFRSRPDGSGLEAVLTGGMDNPVGVAFTTTGERVLSGTFFQIGAAGKRDGLIHAVYGGVYGKENAAFAGHPRTGDLMPIMTHMGAAAPCGSITYRSNGFGDGYAGNVFVCYFNLRKISRHQLVPDGATFRTIDSDFVTSDSPDFHPTDVLEDADGSLLIVDTGGWYKICCPTSQLAKPDVLGGIYRIRKTGTPAMPDPRGLAIDWKALDEAGLARLLADERTYVQDRAIHALGQRGAAAIPDLQLLVAGAGAAPARRNALWTLGRIEHDRARAAIRSALDDRDPSVLQTALQLISLHRDPGALEPLIALLKTGDSMHARLAAEALGRIGDAKAIGPLLAAAGRLGDVKSTASGSPEDAAERILEHALIFALIEIAAPKPLLASLAGSNTRQVRAALVALDQMPGSLLEAAIVIPFLESDSPQLKQTAGWLVGFHPDWGDALAGYFRTKLRKTDTEADRRNLQLQLTQLANSPAIQDLLAQNARDREAPASARLIALRAMAGSSQKATPESWLSALAAAMASGDPALLREALAAARALPPPKAAPKEFAAALMRVGRDEKLPAELRLEALTLAPPATLTPVSDDLFTFLLRHLDAGQPMLMRGAAANVLARTPLNPEQQLVLAGALGSAGALEVPRLLPAFERAPTEAVGRAVIAALRRSSVLGGVSSGTLSALFARYPESVQREAGDVISAINADAARQNARVDELLASVKEGDVRRGQAVFNSGKTACNHCHVIGYGGGRFGPDLTNIGRIRSERELLEAVMYPSATFVRGFEPVSLTTKNGEVHTGLLRTDAADEVVLALGPDLQRHVARADIAELRPSAVSPMPPGMDAVLSRQELSDLVAFLKSRQ